MESVILLLFIMGLTFAQNPGQEIKILKQESDISPDGSYQWSYETENKIQAQETGQLKPGSPEPILEAQGSFSYVADDGTPISVQYVANELGFQPQGEHLPTPPPIPPAIQRALKYIEANPQVKIEERFKGQ
ncbi:unnamed protein product [Brassicogethes aeneus]|uniref:Uncharacterized protein n=1 Tax=Brassicogethes aeneus TaxID=1431903 RepID=A0A9P0B8W0_BRAAE|nr:unnamed protein product [Brassicogethes aeneus]